MAAALFALWNLLVLAAWLRSYHPPAAALTGLAERLAGPGPFAWGVLAANWGEAAGAALVLAGLLALAAGAGAAMRRWLTGRAGRHGLLLGLGAAGLAVLGAGLMGLLFAPPRSLVAPALGALGIVAAGRVWAATRRAFPVAATPAGWPRWSRPAVGAALFVALAGVMGPETGWDALMYHLRLPSLYTIRHKVFHVWHSPYGDFPAQVEMLYLVARMAAGDAGARQLNVVFGALLAATAWRTAGLLAPGRPARGTALVLLLACPTVLALVPRAYADFGFAAFAAAGLLELLRWRAGGGRAALALAGVLAGFGLGSKYVGAFAVPAGLAVVLAAGRPVAAVPAGALLAAVAAPWLAKNWLLTGDPVAPFFGALFGTPMALPGDATPSFLPAPALWPARLRAFLLDGGHLDSPLVPALAGLLPLLAGRDADPVRRAARLAAGAWLATWLVAAPEARFFLPALPALAALLAIALAAPGGVTRVGRAALGLHVIAAVAWAAWLAASTLTPFAMPLGWITARDRLAAGLPPAPYAFAARDAVNRCVPAADRVLFVSHFATYYADRECLAEFHAGTSKLATIIREGGTPDGIAKRFRQRGVRWILSTVSGVAGYLGQPGFYDAPESGWAAFATLLRTRGAIAWQGEGHALIRLGAPHAPGPLAVLPVYEIVQFAAADRLLREGHAAAALAVYDHPPALLRGVGTTRLRAGLARRALGDADGAEADFRAALAAGMDTVPVRLGLADALLARRAPAAALVQAEAAWRGNPPLAVTALMLARAHGALGHRDEARRWIGEALRLRPDADLFRRMAAVLAR